MLRDDRRVLSCPARPGVRCPHHACPGRHDPGICRHLGRLQPWRDLPAAEQAVRIWAGEAGFEPRRDATGGRLRVGLWCPCLGLGGAESWQLALTRAVDPAVIAWSGAAVLGGRGSTDPRMVRELGSILPIGLGLDAARTLAGACDVIVSWAVTNVRDLIAGLDSPPSVVVACHFPGESPWGPGTETMLDGVDRFVAVSELAVDSIPPRQRGRVEVIWNAVDASRLEVRRDRAAMRASWGVPHDATVAGYVGRLSPEKDPAAMLRLAEALPEPWHVILAGEGREREALAAEIRSKNLERAHLVGGDPAVGDVLGALDALVVPSRYESFGLTLAEGLCVGLPVVATRCGIAKLVPGLVREVAVDAPGRVLAEALLADRADASGTRARADRAKAFAGEELGLGRFGRAWTDLLVASAERRKGVDPCISTIRVA